MHTLKSTNLTFLQCGSNINLLKFTVVYHCKNLTVFVMMALRQNDCILHDREVSRAASSASLDLVSLINLQTLLNYVKGVKLKKMPTLVFVNNCLFQNQVSGWTCGQFSCCPAWRPASCLSPQQWSGGFPFLWAGTPMACCPVDQTPHFRDIFTLMLKKNTSSFCFFFYPGDSFFHLE